MTVPSNSPARPRLSRVWLLGLATLVASVGGTGWVLRSQAADKAARADEAPPASGQTVVCIGYVDVAHGLVPLYPVQPGLVTRILAEENARVSTGTPLLQLDDRNARKLLEAAEADLQAAEADLARARKLPESIRLDIERQQDAIQVKEQDLDLARRTVQRMTDRGTGRDALYGQSNIDEAKEAVKKLELAVHAERTLLDKIKLQDPSLDLQRAEAQVRAKKAQRDRAQLGVDECVLKAPVDGSVVRVYASVGETLGPNPRQPAVQFCPAGPRLIRAEVEQEFANRVAVGMKAMIQDDTTTSGLWRGKATRLADVYIHRRSLTQEPFQLNDVRTLECIVELDPGQAPLRLNQRMRVTLENP